MRVSGYNPGQPVKSEFQIHSTLLLEYVRPVQSKVPSASQFYVHHYNPGAPRSPPDGATRRGFPQLAVGDRWERAWVGGRGQEPSPPLPEVTNKEVSPRGSLPTKEFFKKRESFLLAVERGCFGDTLSPFQHTSAGIHKQSRGPPQ